MNSNISVNEEILLHERKDSSEELPLQEYKGSSKEIPLLKRKDLSEGTIVRVDYPNRGRFLSAAGQHVTVKNVIPGQKIFFRVFKKHGDRVEGRLIHVLEKSPLETRPPVCSIFPACGGCLYQTVPYGEQLKMKTDQVQRLLSSVTDEETVFDGIKRSPQEFAYRNKMEFSFGDAEPRGPLTLGLHKKGTTYDVLTAPDCKIVHEDFTKILNATLDYCTRAGFQQYNKRTHEGYLRYLPIRRSETTGEILVFIITSGQREHDFTDWAEMLLSLKLDGKITGIFHGIDDNPADRVETQQIRTFYGRDWITESLLGLHFKLTAFSFFQTNTRGAEVLYDMVRTYVTGEMKEKPVIYDLYSGTGTIAQIVSPAAGHVYGIELVPEAVEAALENAAANGITNCTFLAGDVLEMLQEIEEKPDFIILDPPREGIVPKSLEKIIAYGVPRMVYISCKASSFRKDMEVLREYGWRIERYGLVDMFPETCHVETVCLLSNRKSKPDTYVDLSIDMKDYYSADSIAKMGRCENVTTDVLLGICEALDCDVENIMECVSNSR